MRCRNKALHELRTPLTALRTNLDLALDENNTTDRAVFLSRAEAIVKRLEELNANLLYAHEARHNDGFPHTCTTRNGDDNTLDELGAWAIHHYLALWIAQYGDRNFLTAPGSDPNIYRIAALQDAQVTYLTRFCKEVYTEPAPTLEP